VEPGLHDLLDLLDLSPDDVHDRLGTPALDRCDALAVADPTAVGRHLGELLRVGRTPDGVLTWLTLLPSPVPVAAALAAAHPGLRPEIVEHRIAHSPDDLLLIAPPDVLVPAHLARQPWAVDVIPMFLDDAWQRRDDQRWARLDALLTVGDDTPFAETVTEMLGRTDWARHDPWPARLAGQAVPTQALTAPYRELFDDEEPRVRRASLEADLLTDTFAERADRQWLRNLGRALPGCGLPSCCRPGLFEAELLHRGLRPRTA
jgi:hypothetical protein